MMCKDMADVNNSLRRTSGIHVFGDVKDAHLPVLQAALMWQAALFASGRARGASVSPSYLEPRLQGASPPAERLPNCPPRRCEHPAEVTFGGRTISVLGPRRLS